MMADNDDVRDACLPAERTSTWALPTEKKALADGHPAQVHHLSKGWRLVPWVVVAAAAALRLVDLGYASLTHTEAWRAEWMYNGGWQEARRFPPLQFALGRFLQFVGGRDEAVLRLPYALAGVVVVAVLYRMCAKHVDRVSALCVAATAMSHPVLVYYARRQLEYGLEAAGEVVLFWAGLEVFCNPSKKRLIGLVVAGLLGLALTFTSSILLAAWFPLLTWSILRHRTQDRSLGRAYLTSVLVLLVALIGWYFWLAGFHDRERVVQYYASAEAVWPQAYTPSDLARWVLFSCLGAGHYALGMSDIWSPLNWVIGTLSLLAASAALGLLAGKARPLGLAIGSVGILAVAAGAARGWPFGDIRHSTYLIPLSCIVVGCGLAQIIRRLGRTMPAMVLVLICVVVPAVRAVKATMMTPHTDEHSRPVFEHVAREARPGDALFVYYFAKDAFLYYGRDWTMPVLIQPGSDRADIAAFSARFDDWLARHDRVWFLFAHNWRNEREEWLDHLRSRYRLLDQIEERDAGAYLISR